MPDPLYQRVRDALSEEMKSGRFKPGQKLPSEAALVKKFSTSRITVGRALRELQAKGLIERRAGSGTYVAENARVALPLSFGLLIPDLGITEIFDPICRHIANAPEAAGHALLWGHEDDAEPSKEAQCWSLCQQFIARQVSGVFFAPLEFEAGAEKANLRILRALHEAHVPVVLLDRPASPKPVRSHYDLVGLNNRHAGYIATEHLIQLGLKRIAFMSFQAAESTIQARLAGYRDALRDHSLPDLTTAISETDLVPSEPSEAQGFVCANDKMAALLMRAFLGRGLKVPEDVKLVGIDDVPFARMLPVPLSTVRQPSRVIGQTALRAMLERVKNPALPSREILLSGELVARESSRKNSAEATPTGVY